MFHCLYVFFPTPFFIEDCVNYFYSYFYVILILFAYGCGGCETVTSFFLLLYVSPISLKFFQILTFL